MNKYRIIIILLIIIITAIILWQIYQKRKPYLFPPAIMEGLTSNTDYNFENLKKRITWETTIANISPNLIQYPIHQYCIKGARNSAFTGNGVNADMITYCMKRGCRFLDFEIYYDEKSNVVVSYSTDSAYALDNTNTLSLSTVFNTILSGAFNGIVSPNYSEPLFIQLHIKVLPTNPNLDAIFSMVANSIKTYITKTGLQFSGKVGPNTTLDKLMGKIVIVVNQRAVVDAENIYSKTLTKNGILGSVTNMLSGSADLCPIYTYTTIEKLSKDVNITKPAIHSNNITTNVKTLRQVILDDSIKENPDCYQIIEQNGIQWLPYAYYYNYDNGTELKKYEGIFDSAKSGFALLSYALNNIIYNTPKYGTTLVL